MRRRDKQITDPDEIEAVIREATVCFLALADGAQPYVVPLSFGYRDGALYFHSAPEGRKIDLIRRQPRVGFALVAEAAVVPAERPCRWTAHYRSLVGEGTAVIVDDAGAKRQALESILCHYGDAAGEWDDRRVAATCVIRVDIDRLAGKRSG